MATLNLNEKKIPSAENLRLIAQLCISLANKQSSLEDRCIAPWKSGEVYQKDISYVSHGGYIYLCSVSNNDTDFVESHWTKLSDTISELTKADIEALVNLTPEQITNLQSLIDDTSISTTHTNSSSHIYMAIQDAIAECKDDTLKQIAKKVSGSYKIANTTADIVSADYIYLLSNGSNYDLYVLVDGTATKVGDTNIDLSEYVKTTDLADYMKTSDADGKFATITTVDGKFDKTNILTALDNSATDDQVYSAKAINAELDGVVKKTDISTTINSTSTDDTVPTNKAVYDSLINKVNNTIVLTTADEVNSFDRVYQSFIIEPSVAESVGLPKAPDSTWFCINLSHVKGFKYPSQIAFEYAGIERIMYRTAHNGVWHNWRKIPTTSVADVPVTDVTFTSPNVSKARENEVCKYCVKNGVCYVTLNDLLFSSGYKSEEGFVVLPKPAMRQDFELTDSLGTTVLGKLFLEESGAMHLYTNTTPVTATGYISFSYPVAES